VYDIRTIFRETWTHIWDLVHLPEWTFDRKRISDSSNPNLNSNPNSNPKAQKRIRKNEMTSFLGSVQIPYSSTSIIAWGGTKNKYLQ